MCVFAPGVCAGGHLVLTAQVLQDEIQLPSRLEGVDEIDDERMLHLLQDVPLCLGVGRVLGVAYNHSLAPPTQRREIDVSEDADKLVKQARCENAPNNKAALSTGCVSVPCELLAC